MSNSQAIAAVTTTLRSLISQAVAAVAADADLADTQVTTEPPDRARGVINTNQINIFLYQAMPNAAWSNQLMPGGAKPNEMGEPSLALNLYYLVTVYGRNNDDIFGHRLLGVAMSVLHDHPLLGREEIRAATRADLPNNGLADQPERIRFSFQPLSLEDIFKLWSGFQIQYRLSAAYEVTVVLIDSTRPTRSPLPVLMRGANDRGVLSQADLIPPYPTLEEILLPGEESTPPEKRRIYRFMGAQLGDLLTLSGHHLAGDRVTVRFRTPILQPPSPPIPYPYDRPPEPGYTADRIIVQVPDDPQNWPAGYYTLTTVVHQFGTNSGIVDPTKDRTTNALSIPLAPAVVATPATPLPIHVARDGIGDARVALSCKPEVWPEQRVSLLLGDREVPAEPHAGRTARLTFVVRGAEVGQYFFRLRVDGVDSLLADWTTSPPTFRQDQRVIIS